MTSRPSMQLPAGKPKLFYGHVIVAVSFLIMFVSWGLYVVFGVFFDPILEEFGWSRAMISGAYSLSSILSGVLGIAVGGLTDRFGPRLIVTVCGFFLGAGYMLMSLVYSPWQLYLFYGVVIGAGMSGLWIPLLSPIVRWFDRGRSLMTGIIISGLTIGQLAGPLVISRLIASQGWRRSYLIVGGAVMLITVLLAQLLKPNPERAEQMPVSEKEGQKGDAGSDGRDFTLKEAMRTAQFWLVAVIFFCVGYSAFSVTVHLVPHATLLGIPAVTAATILAINGGIGIVGNFVVGGILGDRIGNRKAFIIGMLLLAASLFWLAPAREVWMLYLFAVVYGLALGDTGTSESPLIARLYGLSSHGLIYGVVGLSWTAGGAVGPFLTGYMCDVIGNYQAAFLVCAIIAALGLALLLILRPTKKRGMAL